MIVLRAIALIAACVTTSASAQQVTHLWIGNQGNFSDGNGSLMVYDVAEMQTATALANFGTLVQSMTLQDGRLYIASNTAGAVDIVDATTRMRVGQIPYVASPRYIAVIPEGKGYVSNLYTESVTVLDLLNETTTGTITVGSNPEDIAIVGSRAYVANSGFGADSTVTVIDTETDTVIERIDVECDGPRHLEVDADQEVWVFCTGKTVWNDDFTEVLETTNGAVTILDGATGMLVDKIALVTQVGAASLGQDSYMSAAAHRAVLLQGPAIDSDVMETQVIVFDTNTHEAIVSFTLAGNTPVGGVAYDGQNNLLYAARIPGFTAPGFVTVHNEFGALLHTIEAGIAPAHLVLQTRDDVTSSSQRAGRQLFTLGSGYPNPFASSVTLPLTLPVAGHVRLSVHDVLGREMELLIDRYTDAGTHAIPWHPAAVSPGIYMVRLDYNGRRESRILVRSQ